LYLFISTFFLFKKGLKQFISRGADRPCTLFRPQQCTFGGSESGKEELYETPFGPDLTDLASKKHKGRFSSQFARQGQLSFNTFCVEFIIQ
jgi:hypothetical protein